MSDDAKPLVAPYGAWQTTLNALQRFAVGGIPPRIDRSAFPGLEWNAASRLLGGLRFLGLIDENGTPQPKLQAMATSDETTRKYVLGELLRTHYAELFKLDLARVTPAHFAEVLSKNYNAKGDTLEKAIRFFVSAATYASIPLSPLLAKGNGRKAGNGGSGRQRRKTPIPGAKSIFRAPGDMSETGPTRVVRLKSGGVLTLIAAVDFLSLSAEDRAFVFGLIDKLGEYEEPEESEE